MALPLVVEQRRNPSYARGLGLAADSANLLESLLRVRRRDGAVGIEARPRGRAGKLAVSGNVLPLAEERLVEGVLEPANQKRTMIQARTTPRI